MKQKFLFSLFAIFTFIGCENEKSTQNPDDLPQDVEQGNVYEITTGPYEIGDFYNEGGKMGVVFEVDETGNHGKIVNLSEAQPNKQWNDPFCSWGLSETMGMQIGASNEYDGTVNMAVVAEITNWESRYPAFAYCASLGKDWYLPAMKELELLFAEDVLSVVNYTLFKMDEQMVGSFCYWSSTEKNEREAVAIAAKSIPNISNPHLGEKYDSEHVRAIAKF